MIVTCEVLGQVWVVHETVGGKLDTLQSDGHVDIIEPDKTQTTTSKKKNNYLRSLTIYSSVTHRAVSYYTCDNFLGTNN